MLRGPIAPPPQHLRGAWTDCFCTFKRCAAWEGEGRLFGDSQPQGHTTSEQIRFPVRCFFFVLGYTLLNGAHRVGSHPTHASTQFTSVGSSHSTTHMAAISFYRTLTWRSSPNRMHDLYVGGSRTNPVPFLVSCVNSSFKGHRNQWDLLLRKRARDWHAPSCIFPSLVNHPVPM